MRIIKAGAELTAHIEGLKTLGKRVGFIPTMGALHEGHTSLIEASNKDNSYTVCSVFVNPTQFNNTSDLKKYPNTIEQDLKKLEAANCDIVYLPEVKDVYPNGLKLDHFDFGELETAMEGKHRPGHFNGVGTVVSKLFNFVRPDKAYFGEKDYQQLAIIQELVKINKFNITIVGCPILREEDGLAMSSRNLRLSPQHRKAAPLILQAMQKAQKLIPQHSPQEISKIVSDTINNSSYLEVEYVEIADEITLQSFNKWPKTKGVRIFTAVNAGEIRLIDNLHLF